jgi:hypothetical protein
MLQIKPTAPTLKALIKIHIDKNPIRPAINNIQESSYKLAKSLNKKTQPDDTITIVIRHKKFK